MKYLNTNEKYGDPVTFDSLKEMEEAIVSSGYTLPEDGLTEGRDYDAVESFIESKTEDNTQGFNVVLIQQEIDYLMSCMMASALKPCPMSSALYEKLYKAGK